MSNLNLKKKVMYIQKTVKIDRKLNFQFLELFHKKHSQDVIKRNVCTNFQEDWAKNVATRV